MAMHISRWFRRMARMADLTRRVWRAIVWYLREESGEARYGRYVEHLRAEHPGRAPMSVREFNDARDEYERLHPTGCCC